MLGAMVMSGRDLEMVGWVEGLCGGCVAVGGGWGASKVMLVEGRPLHLSTHLLLIRRPGSERHPEEVVLVLVLSWGDQNERAPLPWLFSTVPG